ncbi:L-threonylcarbamoyladenylate synthase [Gleimia sp. 6138-11-ORH1]|uniref:L-threonylcarbamoyladenylate synthase n=1 Tax=Gleimia sp. 6138-11-ORH1 TaxID=2973937 RepID=UPI002168E47A|nr:L-threonylcarbamoyladenylate synthase [Gleimia sp. 6138-11-ORH1]MCS4484396.1 L-threonylcarbamoyladenylate synthase [Gleimia sp. 6138-11-ORH1]
MSYLEIHPDNPQPRLLKQVVAALEKGGVIALPTDSGYAICTQMGNKRGMDTIRQIRNLDEKHNFSLLCHDFGQLGSLVHVGNRAFRAIKAVTPGPYTFILQGTKEIPRMMLNKKKHTIGIRIPDHRLTLELIKELGQPLLCSTLILPGETEALWDPEEVMEKIGAQLDLVVASTTGNQGATTVIDYTEASPVVVREGAGSLELF